MNQTLKFVLIAYSITWLILFSLSFYYNSLPVIVKDLWHSLGAFGPAIAALIVIKNKKILKKRLIKYPGIKNLLIALSPLIILLILLLTGLLPFNQFLEDNQLLTLVGLFSFFIPSIFYGVLEEIGWRGYLLPKLQKKHNPISATLILTLIWMFWHLPMFLYRFPEQGFTLTPLSLITFFLLLFSGSLAFSFLFNESKSLLMLIIFHTSYDLTTSNNTGLASMLISILFIIFDFYVMYHYLRKDKHNKEIKI